MISRFGRHLGLATWHKYRPSVMSVHVCACFSWPPGTSINTCSKITARGGEDIFVFRSFVDLFDFEAFALGILNIATAIFGRKFEGQ